MAWESFIRKFILGTQREPFADEDIGAFRRQLNIPAFFGSTEEAQLLETAVFYGMTQKAGVVLPLADAACIPAPIADESLPYCNALVAQKLKTALYADHEESCLELLFLIGHRRQLVPSHLLPVLLHKAHERNNLTFVLPACVGEKGFWLARTHPSWRDLLHQPIDSSAFFAAPLARQVAYLSALRIQFPDKVIPYLQTLWQTANSAARVRLLSLFAAHLSPADLPFLEQCLFDKSKEVQRKVVGLLAALPDTDYIRYMEAQLELLCPQGDWTQIALPERSVDLEKRLMDVPYPDWKASEQEYLLIRLIATVPPQWWTRRWGKPARLLQQSLQHPQQKLLWWGWLQAALKFEDADWLVALYKAQRAYPSKQLPFTGEQLLERTFAAADTFHRIAEMLLEEHDNALSDEHPILDFLGRHAIPLRDHLVRQLIQRIRHRIKNDTFFMDWGLQGLLKHLAFFVNPRLYEWLSNQWNEQNMGMAWASWRNTVYQFLQQIRFRLDYYEALQIQPDTVVEPLLQLYNRTINRKTVK